MANNRPLTAYDGVLVRERLVLKADATMEREGEGAQTVPADAPTDAEEAHSFNSSYATADAEITAACDALGTNLNLVATALNDLMDKLVAAGVLSE